MTALFQCRYKESWRQESFLRMMPADQSFCGSNLPGPGIHNRLIINLKFAFRNAFCKFTCNLCLVYISSLHGSIVHFIWLNVLIFNIFLRQFCTPDHHIDGHAFIFYIENTAPAEQADRLSGVGNLFRTEFCQKLFVQIFLFHKTHKMVSLCSGDHNRSKLWVFQIFIDLTQNKVARFNAKKLIHCLEILNIEKQDRIVVILICILENAFCLLYKSLPVVSACQCILSWQLCDVFKRHNHDSKVLIKIQIRIIDQTFFSVPVHLMCTERIASFQIQFFFDIVQFCIIFKLCLFFLRNKTLHDFFQILFIIQFSLQRLWKVKNFCRIDRNLSAF